MTPTDREGKNFPPPCYFYRKIFFVCKEFVLILQTVWQSRHTLNVLDNE